MLVAYKTRYIIIIFSIIIVLHALIISAPKDMESMLKTAKKTSQALQYYAASGDIRHLLMVQRYLMLVQDINGDL